MDNFEDMGAKVLRDMVVMASENRAADFRTSLSRIMQEKTRARIEERKATLAHVLAGASMEESVVQISPEDFIERFMDDETLGELLEFCEVNEVHPHDVVEDLMSEASRRQMSVKFNAAFERPVDMKKADAKASAEGDAEARKYEALKALKAKKAAELEANRKKANSTPNQTTSESFPAAHGRAVGHRHAQKPGRADSDSQIVVGGDAKKKDVVTRIIDYNKFYAKEKGGKRKDGNKPETSSRSRPAKSSKNKPETSTRSYVANPNKPTADLTTPMADRLAALRAKQAAAAASQVSEGVKRNFRLKTWDDKRVRQAGDIDYPQTPKAAVGQYTPAKADHHQRQSEHRGREALIQNTRFGRNKKMEESAREDSKRAAENNIKQAKAGNFKPKLASLLVKKNVNEGTTTDSRKIGYAFKKLLRGGEPTVPSKAKVVWSKLSSTRRKNAREKARGGKTVAGAVAVSN